MNSHARSRRPRATWRVLVAIVKLAVVVLFAGTFTCYYGQSFQNDDAPVVAVSTCAPPAGQPPINFEEQKYSVNRSRVIDPFDFLPWVKTRKAEVARRIAALVDGKPFTYKLVRDDARDLIGQSFTPDSSEGRFKFRIEVISVENCTAAKTLDVTYQIYSSRILPFLSGAPESRVTERQTPQKTAGMTSDNVPKRSPIHFTPRAAFDQTNKLAGGGLLELTPTRFSNSFIKSFAVDGLGSSDMHFVSAEASGSIDHPIESKAWLAHSEWRFSFAHYSLPTGSGSLKGGHLLAQFSAMTQPFMSGNLTARFGGLVQGGNRQSDIRDVVLTPGTTRNAGFGSLSFYAGINSRLPHNIFSISYGLELGSTDRNTKVDWLKHIADVRHEFWYSLGDHRPLNLESRFTVGKIQVRGSIPLDEKFFGGNQEKLFMPGDSWQIREKPVIRSIPGEQYFLTSEGAGGDRFVSYNLTAAYALWRKPLVPGEVSNNEEVRSEIDDGIHNALIITQIKYETDNDAFRHLVTVDLPLVPGALENLKRAVEHAKQSQPSLTQPLEQKFDECLEIIDTAIDRTNDAVNATEIVSRYDGVRNLLRASEDFDENNLDKVLVCVAALNEMLGGVADLTEKSGNLNRIRNEMEADFAKLKPAEAEKKAKANMGFARRTVNTLLDDVNLFSVGPVFVFDVARIGPRRAGFGGVRCGPGGGIRMELASTTYFTLGYAKNVGRGPRESSGAVFFSIGVRDLFR